MGDCKHPRTHVIDSRFYRSGYSTEESRAVFCDLCRYQRWLTVEAALAQAQAELGMIPAAAADEIARKAHLEHIDLDEVERGVADTGHSLVPLLRGLQKACENGAGEYVHYGATTQDIQDTAQALELRDVLDLVERDLRAVIERLIALAERYRDTLMAGRTHAQYALPMTFGLKVSVWLDEALRSYDRIADCRKRVLVAELFGGVGTLASFGELGVRLLERFADKVGLAAPSVAWHVARDRVAEFLSALAILSGTLARIADEVRELNKSEVREVELAFRHGQLGSSTMPHKRNPETCEQVVTLAHLVKAQAMLGFEGLLGSQERDSRSLRLEWVSVPEASQFTCAALNLTRDVLDEIVVREDAMRRRAERNAEALGSEALMLLLAEHVGKQTAHRLVYDATQRSRDEQRPLAAVLDEMPEISQHLGREDLERALSPGRYLGASAALVDRTVAAASRRLDSG